MRRMIPQNKINILESMEMKDGILEIHEAISSEVEWQKVLTSESYTINANWTVENIYSRLYISNNKLIGVFLVKITNNSGSRATPNAYIQNIIIPEKYSKKIFDYDGKSVYEGNADNSNISIIFGSVANNKNSRGTQVVGVLTNPSYQNALNVYVPVTATDDGASFYSEMRFFLSLE